MVHLHVFGAKCWAKTPTAQGGSKLNPCSSECHLLGYASGSGNYKVQEVVSQRVFILRDVVFEEGQSCHTSASVGEQQIPLFDVDLTPPADNGPNSTITDVPHVPEGPDQNRTNIDQIADHHVTPAEPH